MLDLSKIEAGRITLNNSDFDLYRLLDDLEKMFYLRTKDKQLQLYFERSPNVPQYIATDEVKLRQVLINLLNNALKFTKEGGVVVRVMKSLAPPDNGATPERALLTFEVQDSGVGIAPDELDTLFEAFVQSKSGREAQEGTGLGLPISRQFVRLMGGEMRVSSQEGDGTTFSFDISVRIVADLLKKQAPTRQVIGLMPNQATYRILIVDDHQYNRQLLAELLRPLGFAIQEAANGQQAIEVWEEWQPHLIWMDMRMSVMDGYEATKQIKQTSQGEKTIVIALTASTFEEERAIVLEAGCDDFMRKPFKQAKMFEMMSQYLGVQYLYEEDNPPARPPRRHRRLTTPNDQTTFDTQWLAKIEEAALILDQDHMLSLIDQIHDTAPAVATQLEKWANDFEYDELLNFLKQQKYGTHRQAPTLSPIVLN